jgi:transcriptional regulator with PAS, ATPase and Fis domain
LEALGCGLGAAPAGGPLSVPLPRAVPQADPRSPRAAWEAERLAQVLARHGGNRRAAAEELKVSERTLYRMIRRGGLS